MGFTLEQMRAELGRREEAAAERRGPTRLEPLARVRRWLDAGDDRELFAEAARRLASNVEAERTGGPDMASRIGGLFHLAGEPADARRYLLDSLRDPAAWTDPSDPAGAHYLLGAPEQAIATAADSMLRRGRRVAEGRRRRRGRTRPRPAPRPLLERRAEP